MKFITFTINKSCECPNCGEWGNVYNTSGNNYVCGECGTKFKF